MSLARFWILLAGGDEESQYLWNATTPGSGDLNVARYMAAENHTE